MISARIINVEGAIEALAPAIAIARTVAIETTFPHTIRLTGFGGTDRAIQAASKTANLTVIVSRNECKSHGDDECPVCYGQ